MSSAAPRFHVAYLRTLDLTLSVNAKSEERACFATSALASFGPNRAMASDEKYGRARSVNPKKDATALFISRAKTLASSAAAARAAVEAAVALAATASRPAAPRRSARPRRPALY